MKLEALLVLLAFLTLVGMYTLGCVTVVIFITKNIVRWLIH